MGIQFLHRMLSNSSNSSKISTFSFFSLLACASLTIDAHNYQQATPKKEADSHEIGARVVPVTSVLGA